MARTLVPRHDVVVRVPVVATGGPVPVTDPEDDLPPPWKAALPVPVDAHASVSAAEWNSLLVWARAQRGPQWDAATGMWHVARFSDEYYGFSDNPRQLDPPPEEQDPVPEGQDIQDRVSNGGPHVPQAAGENQSGLAPEQLHALAPERQWSALVAGYPGGSDNLGHTSSMNLDTHVQGW